MAILLRLAWYVVMFWVALLTLSQVFGWIAEVGIWVILGRVVLAMILLLLIGAAAFYIPARLNHAARERRGRTFYQALGVSPKAKRSEIHAACLELGQRFNPGEDPDNEGLRAQFAEVELAYETLMDQDRRRAYDQQIALADRKGVVGDLREVVGDKWFRAIAAGLGIAMLSLHFVSWRTAAPAKPDLPGKQSSNGTVPFIPTERNDVSTPEQIKFEARIRARAAADGQTLSAEEARAIRRAAESVVENDGRNRRQ